jgi:hypothetical protein
MARAEQYRNLYPFLGMGNKDGIEASETSQNTLPSWLWLARPTLVLLAFKLRGLCREGI